MIENGLYVDKPVVRHSSISSFTLSAGSALLIAGSSAKRVRIAFASDGTNIVRLGQQSPIDAGRAINIATGYSILQMDANDYGSLIQGNWFAIAVAGTPVISVVDTVEQ